MTKYEFEHPEWTKEEEKKIQEELGTIKDEQKRRNRRKIDELRKEEREKAIKRLQEKNEIRHDNKFEVKKGSVFGDPLVELD